MKKKDASIIKRKILFQAGLLTLCVMGIGLLAYTVCTSEFFAAILKNITGLDLSSFQSGFRSFLYTGSVGMMLFILVLTGLLVFLIYRGFSKRLMGYLNEISAGVDVLLSPDQLGGETSRLVLSHEMLFIEKKLGMLEETLVNRDQAAQIAERRKNRLVINLAQEIKTPLALLSGHLNRINDEPYMTAERRAQCTRLALEKEQEMHELLNDFFEITRYSLENTKLSPQLIDLNQMFAQIIDLLRPVLVRQGKEIVLNAEESSVIFADPQKIAKAFYSIIKKASIYSEDTSVIYIEALCKGNQTIVSVASYGKTIRKEMLASLLENFYSAQDKIPPPGKAGLGLAVAHEIVLMHHGILEAQSEEGKTAFTVILPLPSGARQQREASYVFENVAHLVSMTSDDTQNEPIADRDPAVPKELDYSIREHEQANISDSVPFGAVNPQGGHWQNETVSLDYESAYSFESLQTDSPISVSGESELRPDNSKRSIFSEAEYPQMSPSSVYDESKYDFLYSEPEIPQKDPKRQLQEERSGAAVDAMSNLKGYSSPENIDFTYFEPEHSKTKYTQTEYPQVEYPQTECLQTENPQSEFPQVEYSQTELPQTEPLQTEISDPVFDVTRYPQGNKSGTVTDKTEETLQENPSFTYFEPDHSQTKYTQTEYPKVQYPKVEYPKTEYPQSEFPKTEYPQSEFPQTEYPQTEPLQTEISDPVFDVTRYPQGNRPGTVPDKPEETLPENPSFTYFEPEHSQTKSTQTEYPQVEYPQVEYPQVEHPQTVHPQTEISDPAFDEPRYPQEDKLGVMPKTPGYSTAENPDFTYFEPERPQTEYSQTGYPQTEYPQTEHLQTEHPETESPQKGISDPMIEEPRYAQEDKLGTMPEKQGYPSEENPDFTYFEPEYQQTEYQQRETPDLAPDEFRQPQEELSIMSAVPGHSQNDIPNGASFAAELARGNVSGSAYDEAEVSQADTISARPPGEIEFCQNDGVSASKSASEYVQSGFAFGQGDPLDAPVTQPDRPSRPSRDYHIQTYHHKNKSTSSNTREDLPIQRGHEFRHRASRNVRGDNDKNK